MSSMRTSIAKAMNDATSAGSDTSLSSWNADSETKSGKLQKKGTFSNWKSVYVVVQAGMMLEFSKKKSTKPRRMTTLADVRIDLAESLTGQPNTFGVFFKDSKTAPVFWKAESESECQHWVKILKIHAGQSLDATDMTADEMLESMSGPAVMAGQTGVVFAINNAALNLLGYTRNQVIGKSVEIFMDPSIAKNHHLYMERYVKTRQKRLIGKPREMEVLRSDGSKVVVELSLGEVPAACNTSGGLEIQFVAQMHIPTMSYDNAGIRKIVDGIVFSASQSSAYYFDSFTSHVLTKLVRNDIVEQLTARISDMGAELEKYKKMLDTTVGEDLSSDSSDCSTDSIGMGRTIGDADSVVEVMQLIASGGGSGAVVYSARVDGWNCVMKSIDCESSSDREIQGLLNEIQILENLPYHKNLVHYLFHRISGQKLQIFVTEYVCTLGDVIRKRRAENKHFSPAEVGSHSMDIIRALLVLHSRHLVHRDLKADNVFVTLNPQGDIESLAVGDFDTAKSVSNKAAQHTVVGTPGYMAPEVLMNGKYSFPVDVFSFGIILYELITLLKPFAEIDNMYLISQQILAGKMPKIDPTSVDPRFKPLIKLYEKCVHLKPSKRPKLADCKSVIVSYLVENSH